MEKILKKAISVLLIAVMVLCSAPLTGFVGFELPSLGEIFSAKAEAVTSGTCGDNLTWNFDESTGELIISGTGDMTDWSDYSEIPWYVYSSSIKTVTISNGVTSVGDYAFFCCYELTSVTIGNDVASIGYYSFGTCAKLKSITIPDSVTNIGNRAFAYCHNLRNVTIPDGVINIEPLAFLDSGYVTIICKSGSYAHVFAIQNGIKYILEDNNGTAFEIKNTVLLNYGGSAGNVVLPADVASVGIDAFKDNKTVKFIEIPYSVTKIHSGAFSNCPNLDSVVIPFTVTEISDSAFSGTKAKIYCYNNSYAHNYAVANGIIFKLITVTLSTNSVRMAMGETVTVQAMPSITLASGVPFVWKSSDASVAVIDENGKVTAKNNGEATISAIAPNGLTLATCSVNIAPAEAVKADVIKKPTQTTISYGDAIILHVDETKVPEGGYIDWNASNGNFDMEISADGLSCKITPKTSGDTTFTATVYDAQGNAVLKDEQTMTSKAGFFDKIIAFFKKLFGATKVIPQAFKGVF